MKSYNKLVRDKIPEIIEKSGRKCTYDVLSDDEFIRYLNNKIVEEVNEYIESNNIEELADLEEVLRTILDFKGIEYEEFERIRLKKNEERGSFKKRLLLKDVID